MNLTALISSALTADVFTLSVLTFLGSLAVLFVVMLNNLKRK